MTCLAVYAEKVTAQIPFLEDIERISLILGVYTGKVTYRILFCTKKWFRRKENIL